MKPGGGKIKGGNYERDICRKLSMWVSDDQHDNIFWRSASSGARATFQRKKGVENKDQAADISAISEEGFILTNFACIECKAYKDLGIANFVLGKKSKLLEFFLELETIAKPLNKLAMLVAKQDYKPEMLLTREQIWEHVRQFDSNELHE